MNNSIWFAVIFGSVGIIFAGWLFGCLVGQNDERRRAVKAGVARYVAGEDGEPVFTYNDPK